MLTIGEFSRLCRVSPRMLRHYDALGLLRPEEVGENGYRYYRQSQLAQWVRIQRLKDYGFPLGDIPSLLDLAPAQLTQRLEAQLDALRHDLVERQARIRRLEADILRMEGIPMQESKYHVILMPDPEQTVFGIRRTVPVTKFHDLFQELFQELARLGLKQAGPIQMLYHGEEFDRENADVEVQAVVESSTPSTTRKPAYETCAAVVHKGPYEGLPGAYEALTAWMAQHPEYRICGPAIDRYLNDPDITPPDELETGILFPVEKIEP